MANEWFRSTDWSEAARAEFERRLGRARSSSRAQYLRIKGLALAEAGVIEGARELWKRVLRDDGEFAAMQGFAALEHLGDSYVDDDPPLAERYYRRLLADNPELKFTTATQHIKLAELLIRRRRDEQNLEEAADILVQWTEVAHLPFPEAHFRWNMAVIELAEATRDREAARGAARRALALVARGPVFPRHKTVGIAHADQLTLERLEKLAK